MISLDIKAESTSSSPVNLDNSATEEEPTLSFSELLKGAKEKGSKDEENLKSLVDTKKDDKIIKDDNIILAIDDTEANTSKSDVKTNSLLSLLKNENTQSNELEINPKLSQNLTQKELKTLISDSKEYLKSQITQSDGYKQAQIKELPKTLDGLVNTAKTLGVDVSKITLEEVSPKTATLLQNRQINPDLGKQLQNQKESVVQKELPTQKETLSTSEIFTKKQSVDITTPTAQKTQNTTLKDALNITKQNQEVETKEIKNISENVDKKAQVQIDTTKTSSLKEPMQNTQASAQLAQNTQLNSKKSETKDVTKEIKTNVESIKTSEKTAQVDNSILASISSEVSKMVSSSESTTSSLEQLLSNSKNEEDKNSLNSLLSTSSKTQTENVLQTDDFEVKLNEAKQMIKYLSNDVKSAIDNYKSPFTRLRVQLNPQNLGDVDLTVVQRGNNLHVNLSSNNVAINTLAMNMNELRTQLQNSGINNASFNFNSQDNSGQNAGQQQQQNGQNNQNAHEQYSYFENEEQNEEILKSLEIVVPRYI